SAFANPSVRPVSARLLASSAPLSSGSAFPTEAGWNIWNRGGDASVRRTSTPLALLLQSASIRWTPWHTCEALERHLRLRHIYADLRVPLPQRPRVRGLPVDVG